MALCDLHRVSTSIMSLTCGEISPQQTRRSQQRNLSHENRETHREILWKLRHKAVRTPQVRTSPDIEDAHMPAMPLSPWLSCSSASQILLILSVSLCPWPNVYP